MTVPLSSLEIALLIGRGLLIVLLLRALAYLLDIAPLRRSHKQLLQSLGPLLAAAVALAYVLSAVQQVFAAYPAVLPLALGAALVGAGAAVWPPLRDLLSGAWLRAGQVLRAGDEVQVGELRGRVERLCYRRLLLRTAEGEALVPYGLLSRSAIVRAGGGRAEVLHSFRVRPIPGVPRLELHRAIRESALLCHWASPAREPVLSNAPQEAIDVTVFAIDSDYAPEIESAVRRRLAALEQAAVEQARAAEGLTAVTRMPPRDADSEAGGDTASR